MKSSIKNFFSNSIAGIEYYTKGIYVKFNDENIFFLSAGIAFNGILCLIPFLLLATSVIGMVLNSSALSLQKIDDFLNTAFPAQPYAQQIKTSLKGIIRDLIKYRSTFGLYGIGILIYASASMFSSVRYVLNKIFRLQPPRLVIVSIIENILLVLMLGLLFVIANFFSWLLEPINLLLKEIPEITSTDISHLTKSISYIASIVAAFIMFFIVFRFIPAKGITNKVAFISAFTTTSLWWIAGKGFGLYLSAFHPYSKLYGTYAFILVFLLWVYYSSIVFVVGVIVGQLYRERISNKSIL